MEVPTSLDSLINHESVINFNILIKRVVKPALRMQHTNLIKSSC
jgi:hypothetical protein